jgi:hypothetical protein
LQGKERQKKRKKKKIIMADKLDSALDLMRRLPPSDVEDNLAGLIGETTSQPVELR